MIIVITYVRILNTQQCPAVPLLDSLLSTFNSNRKIAYFLVLHFNSTNQDSIFIIYYYENGNQAQSIRRLVYLSLDINGWL